MKPLLRRRKMRVLSTLGYGFGCLLGGVACYLAGLDVGWLTAVAIATCSYYLGTGECEGR